MMTWDLFWLFVPACFALNLAFGPNNLMSLTVSAQHGFASAVLAGFGRLAAFAPMIAISATGLGLLMAASALTFTIVKTLGAAYLIYLGIRLILSKEDIAGPPKPGRPKTPAMRVKLSKLMRREFLVAIGNPKAILIFTAFFPQFVDHANYWESFALVGVIFLILELGAIAVYAAIGAALARTAKRAVIRWFTKASGIGMIVFGSLLIFAKRPG